MRKCHGVKQSVLHACEGLQVEKKRVDRMKIGKTVTDEKKTIEKTITEGIDHGGMIEIIVTAAERVTNTIAVVNVMKALEKMLITTITKGTKINLVGTAARKDRDNDRDLIAETDGHDLVARSIIQKTDTTEDNIATNGIMKRNDSHSLTFSNAMNDHHM